MSSVVPFLKSFKSGIKLPPLVRNISITFGENVLTKGLSFLMILILTRTLGPNDYGKYSFIFVTVALCSALFDFGMENTAVRFASKDKTQKQSIFGLYLSVKLCTLSILVAFFFIGGGWFLTLMNKQAVTQYLPFLIVGLLGESLFFVNDTYLQANQQFKLRAFLNIARYTVTVLYVLFLLKIQMLTLEAIFYVYWVPLLLSFVFMGKYIEFIRAYFKKRLKKSFFVEICRYEQWMFIYSIANNLLGRVDFFMLGFWVNFHQLGIYNAAFQLCSIVSFLPLVIGKVLLPTLSELKEEEIFRKTSKLIRVTCLICLFAGLMIPLTYWVVPLILGKEYLAAIPILQILLLAFVFSLMGMPYEQSLYSLGKPKLLSFGRYFQLFMIIVINVILLQLAGNLYGAYIVALTGLTGRILYFLFTRHFYLSYEKQVIAKRSGLSRQRGIEWYINRYGSYN